MVSPAAERVGEGRFAAVEAERRLLGEGAKLNVKVFGL